MSRPAWFPACFRDARQYRAWRSAGERSGDGAALRRSRHCLDCTAEYQKAMLAAGRCGHPEVKFTKDADGLDCGVRPLKRKGKSNA